jgi:hypothetical protein
MRETLVPFRVAGVLFCLREGRPAAKLYFDQRAGLLVRLVRYAESPLGVNPSQIDNPDYRDVDGVKVPFRVTLSQPGSSFSVQMEEVQQNVVIDAAKVAKPVSDHLPASSFPPIINNLQCPQHTLDRPKGRHQGRGWSALKPVVSLRPEDWRPNLHWCGSAIRPCVVRDEPELYLPSLSRIRGVRKIELTARSGLLIGCP